MLSVSKLSVMFPPNLRVVREVSFEVGERECAALVGESGCGKSVSAMALTRLPPTHTATLTGEIVFNGVNLLSLPESRLRHYRRQGIAYVFQDPANTLNPVLRVGTQLREALPRGLSRTRQNRELQELVASVQLPERVLSAYPHELSGGMQQRIVVAMAMATRPKLLIADEPTTALDVTLQHYILTLLDALRREREMSILLITHNLGIVARFADTAFVMYAGETVESGATAELLAYPRHPYTQGLMASVPRLDMKSIEELKGIPGRVPHPTEWTEGCAFASRCPKATRQCHTLAPPLTTQGAATLRCYLASQNSMVSQ